MSLSQLRYAKGSIKRRKRLGDGTGSSRGGTCGRGTKGLKSRSGGKVHPWFEGGQMPLQRRSPKRGFRKRCPLVYQVVNLRDLERVEPGSVVDAAALAEKGLIRDPERPVKVLGDGEVKVAYSIKVTAASQSAVRKIEAAGGSVEVSRVSAGPAAEAKEKLKGGAIAAPGDTPDAVASARPEVKPEARAETQVEVKPKAKSETGPEARPGARSGTEPEAELEEKPEEEPEMKPEAKAKAEPEAKSEAKPEEEDAGSRGEQPAEGNAAGEGRA